MALDTEKQLHQMIDSSERVLVAFRREWSADGLASALALAELLESRGKAVDVMSDGFSPNRQVEFLPGLDRVRTELGPLGRFVISLDTSKVKVSELSYEAAGDRLDIIVTPKAGQFAPADVVSKPSTSAYDLIVTVDTPDLASLGRPFAEHPELFYDSPIVNLDHDPHNESYGNLNLVDITATSCAEIIFRSLVDGRDRSLSANAATQLLTGIISKTRSFRSGTVTPQSLDAAAALVAAGARRDDIVQNLYKTRSLSTLKLWGRALARLKYDDSIRMSWALLVRQDFVHAGSSEECLPEVIDELMTTAPEAEIVGLIYESDAAMGNQICALVSSDRHANSLGLVPDLRPEGHRRLARICFPESRIQDAEQAVLRSVRRALGKESQPNFVGRNDRIRQEQLAVESPLPERQVLLAAEIKATENETMARETIAPAVAPRPSEPDRHEVEERPVQRESSGNGKPNGSVAAPAMPEIRATDGLSLSALMSENVVPIKSNGKPGRRQKDRQNDRQKVRA